MRKAIDSLFSDRRREGKAALALGLAGLLAIAYQAAPAHQDLGFRELSRVSGPGLPPGKHVGPEHLRVKEAWSDRVVVEKFGDAFEVVLPGGDGRTAAAAEAPLRPGDWVVVVARHRGAAVLEAVSIRRNPERPEKLVVSAIAALLVVLALPFFFRWERGALRPRLAAAAAHGEA